MLARCLITCALVACEVPPPQEPIIWAEQPLPDDERRLEPAVAALGVELVIAGGYATSLAEGLEITDEVFAIDTLTGETRRLPPLPVRWTHGALAGHGGRLFLLGGLEDVQGTPSGRAFILEAEATEWREVEPMPRPRGAAGVLVSPPFIYLLGGSDRSGPLADVLAFDMIDETWIVDALPPLPTARSHTAVMEQADGTVVIAGGIGDAGPLSDSYRLQTIEGERVWKIGEPMSERRGGCAYGTAFGSLVCAGGEGPMGALDLVEHYNPVTDTWTVLPPMPEPRAGAQGAMIGGKLYVVGGSRSLMFEPTASVLVFSFVETIR